MDIARITSKGQITIPVGIRRKLGVKAGDKVLFIEESGKVYILNSSLDALKEAQASFAGAAERAGLKTEKDVMDMMKDFHHGKA